MLFGARSACSSRSSITLLRSATAVSFEFVEHDSATLNEFQSLALTSARDALLLWAVDIARMVAEFVAPVRETLELALYDLRLHDDTADIVRGALVGAHERGVHVRLVYNLDEEDEHPPVPPPPKTEPALVESLPFETAAVPGWPDLMHHKYVVRDREAVWSGSTNWTDDSWSREENVIVVVVESSGVAIRFQEDFAQLWKKRKVAASGRVPTDP